MKRHKTPTGFGTGDEVLMNIVVKNKLKSITAERKLVRYLKSSKNDKIVLLLCAVLSHSVVSDSL